MSRSHTRKPAPKALRAVTACLGALLLAAAARAADSTPANLRVSLETTAVGAAWTPPRIRITGGAPVRCAPTTRQVTLDGVDLSIELATPDSGCNAQRLSGFSLSVDPAKSAGLPLLPGQVYRARVYAVNSAGTASLVAFKLLDTNNPGSAPVPENGFWWSEASTASGPASPGNGLSIETQGDKLAVGLFGFADSGAATWSFGSTTPSGRIATISLVQLANGDPPFAPSGNQPLASNGPRLELEFLSPTRARAWLVRNTAGRDTEVRALTLARSRFADGAAGQAWSGQWVLVGDDGATPRLFDLAAPANRDAETFHLTDTGSDARLDCRLAAGTPHPELCTLSAAGAPLADFDQVGLDHLTGRTSAGTRVKLLRVPH